MRSILAGTETEYGLLVEGHGAEEQIDDAIALVRSYPDECFVGWDYRFESPRADLRGFKLERLAFDPEDAKFDRGRTHGRDHDIRSDRILPNGARFYNDHGHPEYATPECFSLEELMLHDAAGEIAVLRAARAFASLVGKQVRVYKNNTDFHGSAYGSHESYLVPRRLGFEGLFPAVLPMLVVRQVLTGSGKVGSENGAKCDYQLSQRADFFVEPANAETLFRRPIFNTRDEPHADPRDFIRLHVISGDANMIARSTARKVGLIKLACSLAEEGSAPIWKFRNPVQAFQSLSRDATYEFRIELEGGSWTNAYEVFESYFAAAESTLDLDDDARWVIHSSRELLRAINRDHAYFCSQVDWAAKKRMLESFLGELGVSWGDPSLRSYDLEYHNIDPEEGLHWALVDMNLVENHPRREELYARLREPSEPNRSMARGIAVSRFGQQLRSGSWSSLTFEVDGKDVDVELLPEVKYHRQPLDVHDVGTFIQALRSINSERSIDQAR